jgi:epidermal growth factor receptor substrate 15
MTERGALDFREFAMGMYLIQAIQSCYMASVPSTIPPELQELFSDPALLDLHPTAKRPAHSLQSKASLRPSPSHSHSHSHSQILPSVPESNIPMIPVHSLPDDSWDVSLIERAEAENHFQKLDLDHKGYIEGVTAANFMLSYKLSSADLAHIWCV